MPDRLPVRAVRAAPLPSAPTGTGPVLRHYAGSSPRASGTDGARRGYAVTDPILRLDPERLSVEPGGQVALTLTVTNPGTIVDGYTVDVVSTTPLPWVQVSPSTLSVYPQQEATAVITFAPPSGLGAPSGSLPFGVRVWSESQGGGSAVAEGRPRRRVGLRAPGEADPDRLDRSLERQAHAQGEQLGERPRPAPDRARGPRPGTGLPRPPGGAGHPARRRGDLADQGRTRHPVLRGSSSGCRVQIACEPDAPAGAGGPVPATSTTDRPVADGAFNQKPILTRMVVVVAGVVLLAGIGAAAWALTHSGESAGPDANTNPDRPTGFKALDNKSPENVQLVWDEMDARGRLQRLLHRPRDREATGSAGGGCATTVNAGSSRHVHVLRPRGSTWWARRTPVRAGVRGDRARSHQGRARAGRPVTLGHRDASSCWRRRRRRRRWWGWWRWRWRRQDRGDPGAEPLDFLSVVGQGSPDATGVAVTRQKLDEYVAAGVRVQGPSHRRLRARPGEPGDVGSGSPTRARSRRSWSCTSTATRPRSRSARARRRTRPCWLPEAHPRPGCARRSRWSHVRGDARRGGYCGRERTMSLRMETGPSSSGVVESKTDPIETRRRFTSLLVSSPRLLRAPVSGMVTPQHTRPDAVR